MKTIIAVLLVGMLAMGGCPMLGNIPEDTQNKAAETIGFDVAYFTLMNNPVYIPIIEIPLKATIKIAEDETVDVDALINAIVDYLIEQRDRPELAQYSGLIKQHVSLFENLFIGFNLDIPEEAATALRYVRHFLSGALAGLEAAK